MLYDWRGVSTGIVCSMLYDWRGVSLLPLPGAPPAPGAAAAGCVKAEYRGMLGTDKWASPGPAPLSVRLKKESHD